MDNNAIKLAWAEMNRRIEQQDQIISNHFYKKHLTKSRNALWPLFIGQLIQMLAGIGVILLGVATWQPNIDVIHVFISGLVIHLYGIMLVAFSGIMLGKMKSIDYSASVTEIQQKLAKLRLFHIVFGRIIGLPWWVLWVPFAISFFAVAFGVDMYSRMPLALNISLAFGLVGLIATWLFHRWTKNPARAQLRSTLDKAETGSSLRKAQEIVDELEQFKSED